MLHSGTLSTAAPPSAAAVMARSLGCIYTLARQSASSFVDGTHFLDVKKDTKFFVRGLLRLPG